MNEPASIRKYVREVMAFAGDREWTERRIFDAVDRLAADPLQVDELKAALAWNEARGFIAAKADEDAARAGAEAPRLWVMTAAGRAKEGLA